MELKINLEHFMIKYNLTVEGLANKAGIDKNTISRYKRNVSAKIDLKVFAKICEALNVKPSDLLIVDNNKTALAH